jgi:hypothetical protein
MLQSVNPDQKGETAKEREEVDDLDREPYWGPRPEDFDWLILAVCVLAMVIAAFAAY